MSTIVVTSHTVAGAATLVSRAVEDTVPFLVLFFSVHTFTAALTRAEALVLEIIPGFLMMLKNSPDI